jgi:hypothetical protein
MEFHNINTHHKLVLHVPLVNQTKVQKGVHYSRITLFNFPPPPQESSKLHTTSTNLNTNWKVSCTKLFSFVEEHLDRDNKFELEVSQ